MKANELRIGNFVHQHSEWGEKLPKIKIIEWEEGIWYRIGECLSYIEDYQPIPLTEEWLIKFGFENTSKGLRFGNFFQKEIDTHDEFYLRPSYEGGYYWGINNFEELDNCKPIQYVHQLQNLYFALTGEELYEK